jgi:lactate permease
VSTLWAALPILVVLALMVGARWPASRAGVVGAGLAFVVAVAVFGFARDLPAATTSVGAVGGTLGEALFVSATILWIVLPALAIHHLQVATGATERLRVALGGLARDPRLHALLVGWFFALFVEGPAGFGASVALAAPFLVGVGYRPLDAVVVAMLGHAIGVSFGAIGTPIVPQVAATGLAPTAIAAPTATLHLVAGWTLLAVMVVVASRAVGRPARGAIWGWAALAGVAFLVPSWLLATLVGPELPTLAGSLVGAGLFVAVLRLRGRRHRPPPAVPTPAAPVPPIERAGATTAEATDRSGGAHPPEEAPPSAGALLRAGAPYLALIALVLVTRLVAPVRATLGGVELAWTLPGGFGGTFAPLTHPGTLLALAFVGGAAVQRVPAAWVLGALRTTVRQLGGVTVALVAMLTLARVMVHGGLTPALAEAAAGGAGSVWPLLAPLVGVLGTFVTGSATASNVLFTDLQVATAEALGLPVATMVGAQGYGAAVGNIVCPHNIVAAGATVGLTGAEGEVLRRTLAPAVGYALLGGALVMAVVAAT